MPNMVDRWSSMAEGLSPRRVEMKRLADAGREVIERMATTDAPHEVIERAAELLEAAAHELDGPGQGPPVRGLRRVGQRRR